MEKSGQDEINKEQESGDSSINKEGNSVKLNFIKEEVTGSGADAEAWSAVLSSPKNPAGSEGLIDPLLEDGTNCGDNSDTDVDGWINDGMGNTVPHNDSHATEKGILAKEDSVHHHLQQMCHEKDHGHQRLLKYSTFTRESNLAEHMSAHTGEDQTFVPRSRARRHIITHATGGKRYPHGQKTSRRQGPKTTYPWTEEQEEDLVDWWRQNECLYNSSAQGYLDRSLRERLFASKAEEIGSGCTAEDIQTHLRSLRTKLNHILKEDQGLGPIPEGWQPRTPRCRWVWERLDFLLPFIIHRNIKSNNKITKGSSGEDSPSGSSDISMGMEPIPGPSNSKDIGPGTSLRESYVTAQSRVRGKTKAARKDIPSKKSRLAVNAQLRELRAKPTTTILDQSMMSCDSPHTTIHHQSQLPIDVQETSITTIPTTTSHHQPVVSSDEEEVKAFLGHLKCTLLRIPTDLRMEVQADILAMVYARHREHRQLYKQP